MTLILQSCPPAERDGWLGRCLDSVAAWARARGYAYRWLGDELFNPVPAALRDRLEKQAVIASDLARLRQMQGALESGADAVVWFDADVFVFDPKRLHLPATNCAVGRELWIQADAAGRLRTWKKVHNAFLLYRPQASGRNSSLDFYADTAERLLGACRGGMPPQFIGPKLLTALHNVVQWPVLEEVGMFSPAVMQDLANGGGPALELLQRRSAVWPAAANLCRSCLQRGELSHADLVSAMERLTAGVARDAVS